MRLRFGISGATQRLSTCSQPDHFDRGSYLKEVSTQGKGLQVHVKCTTSCVFIRLSASKPIYRVMAVVLFNVTSKDAESGSADPAGKVSEQCRMQFLFAVSTYKIITRYHTEPSITTGRSWVYW